MGWLRLLPAFLSYRAFLVASSEEGTVTLEALESKKQVTVAAEQLLLANVLPEDGVENMTR